ncbi:unnamed protein product [Linum trigynum]|uniref:Uncharacterized protein n=1 Tax=Linum trigynum TaxID=586398 RepID=A0AAV2FK99_9ROSI
MVAQHSSLFVQQQQVAAAAAAATMGEASAARLQIVVTRLSRRSFSCCRRRGPGVRLRREDLKDSRLPCASEEI